MNMTESERYKAIGEAFLNRMTAEQESRIIELVDDNKKSEIYKIIAKEFELPQRAVRVVYNKLRTDGKIRDRIHNRWSNKEISKIQEMLKEGHNIIEIASELKRHESTIKKKIKELNGGDIPIIDIPGEEWRKVYENYEIHGRLRRIGQRKIINGRKNKDGYIRVTLKTSEGSIEKFIHVLVAEAFIPNPEGKEMVDHGDGNPANNFVNNLSWVTAKENANNPHRIEAISAKAENNRIDKEIREHLKCVFDLGISKLELIRRIVDYQVSE